MYNVYKDRTKINTGIEKEWKMQERKNLVSAQYWFLIYSIYPTYPNVEKGTDVEKKNRYRKLKL